jgi:thioredoxin reductase (NADPH)
MQDVIIIGGGPGGYSCALYCARYNLSCLIISKERGGLVTKTHLIENWPAEKSITGFELAMKMEDQVTSLGVEIVDDEVVSVFKKDDVFTVNTSSGISFESKTIVFATGTIRRKLGSKGEDEFYGKGVSYCATCDAAFYKGKIVGMVGGSDSAVKEAIYLASYALKVYIIYRKEYPRAEPYNLKKMEELISLGKIEIVKNANIVQINGDKKVNSVKLDTMFKDSYDLMLDGLFIEIGSDANSILLVPLNVQLNAKKEVVVDKMGRTNVDGVFACGDLTDNSFKQAITASSQGASCANSCFEYLGKKNGQ